jgi:hypothetical protein
MSTPARSVCQDNVLGTISIEIGAVAVSKG